MGTLFCFVTCFKIKKFFLIKWDLKTKIYGIVQSDHFSEEVFCLHRHEETTLLKKMFNSATFPKYECFWIRRKYDILILKTHINSA